MCGAVAVTVWLSVATEVKVLGFMISFHLQLTVPLLQPNEFNKAFLSFVAAL